MTKLTTKRIFATGVWLLFTVAWMVAYFAQGVIPADKAILMTIAVVGLYELLGIADINPVWW